VIGGGPAGLAAALHLSASPGNLSVAVLERGEEPRAKIGETVPPEIRPVLEELGVWEAFVADGHLPGWGTSSCWGSGEIGYNDFLFQPGGSGWHLDRARFEKGLERAAVARGVRVVRGASLQEARELAGGWSLAVRTPAGERRFRARMVVDASGRQAAFARRQGAHRLAFDRLVGAYVFCRRAADSENGLSLVEAAPEGWWYSAALPGDRRVACFMTDADLLRRLGAGGEEGWRAQAAGARHTARRLLGTAPLGAPQVQPASSSVLEPIVGRRWLAVGDAASTFDPLSSRGILKALLSGVKAGDAVRRALDGDGEALPRYGEGVWNEFERYLEVRERHYATEGRWPGSPFWSRRQQGITLDPRREIARVGSKPLADSPGLHLPPDDRALLLGLCAVPRPAHGLVAELKARSARRYSDRRLVLALQHLLAAGAVA
jgi:flavin-dependent dehydrogenase